MSQTSLIDSIIAPSSLQYIVENLAHDSMQGRFTGSKEATTAANIIADEFRKAGALPLAGNNGYFMPFFKYGLALNVIAAIPGKSKAGELVLFGAHYDHIGTTSSEIQKNTAENGRPEKGDRIYNGANDNASGVSGLIHLARYFGHLKNNERTLIFIAFSGEELGLLGADVVSRSFDPKVVMAMVNMDMIGRPTSPNYNRPIITGAERSDLLTLMNDKLYALAPDYGPSYFKGDWYVADNLFRRSDNFCFALKGIPAHTIMTSSPKDMYYHSLNDEADKLDYNMMAKLVKAIALGSMGLADGTDTPKRLNPSGLQQP